MTALSILFVTSRFPLPLLSGDRARAFHQLRVLSRRHRVTLVTYEDRSAAAHAHKLLEDMGVRVVTVPFTKAGAALRWAALLDASRLQRYERQICAEAAAALVVAQTDREAIGASDTLSVVPNGVDLSAFPQAPATRDRHHVVFTGNLGYFPNVDAVLWFAQQVLPIVWREEPETKLTIAGARPHRRIIALAQHEPRITVAGNVDHMHPFLAAARLAVAPMRAGSGQLLKILEAMSTGTPVVTTTRGSSGIEAKDGEHLLIADQPEAFARHVVSLIRDDRLATRLAAAGHTLVERQYTWDRSVADLERIYEQVVACTPSVVTV